MLAHQLRRRRAFANFSFVASAQVDGDTISYPAATQIGDLLVFFDAAAGHTASYAHPTDFTGIGFTDFLRSGGTRAVIAASWRLATATSGTVKGNFTQATGAGSRRKILAVFRPAAPIATVQAFDHDSVMAASNPAGQTISALGGGAPLVALGAARRFGAMQADWPLNLTTLSGSSTGHRAGYALQNIVTADISVESPGYSSEYSGLQTFYLRGVI